MKKTVIANWKMCGTPDSSKAWAQEFTAQLSGTTAKSEIVVCPPFPLISILKEALGESPVKLGAQNCHIQPEGAYTGETSALLLNALGCEYVIVGHSERRAQCGESSDIVRQKATRAIKTGLIPVICIGETATQRENGKTLDIINQQIEESLPFEAAAGNFILAYEPVWAIGSGNLPTMDEITQVHRAIITNVSKRIALDITQVSVLYGGSVKPDNAGEIMALPEVSGVLVGGASLKAEEFYKIAASC